MIAFIIFLLACASGFLLALKPKKDPHWQEDLKAELVYRLDDEEHKNKWLAKIVFDDEVFYVIVNAADEHYPHDVVDVESDDVSTEFMVYTELNR